MDIDLYDPDVFARRVPHDQFAWMRDHAPVHRNPAPDPDGFWSLTRYEDIVEASHHPEIFSSAQGTNIEDMAQGLELMMVNMDAPAHTKLRGLVNKGFLPKMVAAMEPHIREITNSILDSVAAQGECDFVTDVAAELPLQVIAEMIGIPQEDRHKIFDWSNRMIGLEDPEYGTSIADATEAAMAMWAYADELAQGRRTEPREDVVSILVNAEIDGEALTQVQFDMFFLLLAVAGNETTRNLISGGMHALLENRDQLERLTAEPSLLPGAVEEMLRWVTPVMHFRRTLTQDVELHGQKMREGDKVVLWYISANRDDRQFENANVFDVARRPNIHLTFGGGGPHFCLGFSLAQLEIRVMFETLLERLRDIEAAGPPARLRSNFINGIKHLPVRFKPERL